LTRLTFALLFLVLSPGLLLAQGTNIAFGGLSHDSTLPIELSADELSINQADGTAKFVGNVVIGQGDMRISAGSVLVEYASTEGDATGEISRLVASGGVVLVNGAEAAEAAEAIYTIATGEVVMSGGVILTQGRNALSADRMVVNLKEGTAYMVGRVKSIIQAGDN